MRNKLHWTLLAVATLGRTASADDYNAPRPATETLAIDVGSSGGSRRGVAQDYMVLPSGGEITGAMKFVTAEPMALDAQPLRFSDLALFTLGGRYALLSKLELSAGAGFLAKHPSDTSEKPWQNVGVGLRSPLAKHVALAISGSGGHLIDHAGRWTQESITLQWRHPIEELVTFDMAAGIDGVGITAPGSASTSAFLTEVAFSGSALFREPSGHWGAWIGLGYAIPVNASGTDPTTRLAIDPQPRLDFHVGTVLSLRAWDLFAELAVVDRGDLANPATRLPILDGGFDQRQILFGVTRHITVAKHRRREDDAMQIGQR